MMLAKIGLAVAITAVLWWILYNCGGHLGAAFIPCKTQGVIENPPPFAADWCTLQQLPAGLPGINVAMTPGTFLVLALVFLVLPYVASCATVWLVQRRKRDERGSS